ncbi:MAG: hypothetical protein JXM70_15710 [Pirellulales bacterium]|nr:hypothetical protein [Pirellulales bacterium]
MKQQQTSKHTARGHLPRKQAAGFYPHLLKETLGLLLLALTALLSISCAQVGDPADGDAAKQAGSKVPEVVIKDRSEVESGPVRVTAVVNPPRLALSDEAKLTLSIEYEDGVSVKFPPFGKKIGGFMIRDVKEPLPKTVEGRHLIEETFVLEPAETGRLVIWPITVTYTDSRPDGDGKQHSLRTEELSVNVTSVVEPGEASLDKLRPVTDPVALPFPFRWVLWASVACVLLIAVLAGLFWWRRKAIERAKIRILTPAELAAMALDKLRESHLAEKDAKLYYVELTGIVRLYIERTTGIRAPEQTTEEFLREIATRDTFDREESVRFRNFLEAADLVKFAAHRPRPEDIEESFARAEDFVGYSKNEEMTEDGGQMAEDRKCRMTKSE